MGIYDYLIEQDEKDVKLLKRLERLEKSLREARTAIACLQESNVGMYGYQFCAEILKVIDAILEEKL